MKTSTYLSASSRRQAPLLIKPATNLSRVLLTCLFFNLSLYSVYGGQFQISLWKLLRFQNNYTGDPWTMRGLGTMTSYTFENPGITTISSPYAGIPNHGDDSQTTWVCTSWVSWERFVYKWIRTVKTHVVQGSSVYDIRENPEIIFPCLAMLPDMPGPQRYMYTIGITLTLRAWTP